MFVHISYDFINFFLWCTYHSTYLKYVEIEQISKSLGIGQNILTVNGKLTQKTRNNMQTFIFS